MTLVGVFRLISSRNDDEVDQTLQNFFCKMFFIGKAVCFILAIFFTIVTVITNSQNSSRRVPPPRPFFTRDAWVEDFYEGELYYALLEATKYDVVFLMLYAPWDADSQNARTEFETACRYFVGKVYCAAVNCWQSHAECKNIFDDIVTYPVFLVDLHNIPSIRYHGEIVASHIIRFLTSVINPLQRICSLEKFHMLRSTCDALVVAYQPIYKWYKRYYAASLQILEYDPRRDVCWSIVTDEKLARSLQFSTFSLKLYLWNESKPFSDSFTSKNVIKWVREQVQVLTPWLFFTSARSNRLADLVQGTKAVILFTPRNMYLEYTPAYLLFKEAVLEFKSCFTNTGLEKRKAFIAKHREQITKDYNYWNHICRMRFGDKISNLNFHILDANENLEEYAFNSPSHLNITNAKRTAMRSDFIWKYFSGVLKSNFNSSENDITPQGLVIRYIREKCRQINMLKKTHEYHSLLPKSVQQSETVIPDTLCRLNDSYTFFVVDSLLYPHFASSLGINLNKYNHLTSMVVFSNKDEEAFILAEEFNSKRVFHEFLINSVNDKTPRWKKSTEDTSLLLNRYNKSDNLITNEVAVLELTSESFQSVVLDSSQVSAYTFVSVAHALRNYTHIKFTRVDSENNDLLWHLVPHSYPTIILFPAERKSESVVFSPAIELTIENLLDFVLSNTDTEMKLNHMIKECAKYRNREPVSDDIFVMCVNKVKAYCLQVMNNLAKTYRQVTSLRIKDDNSNVLESVLNRLRHVKSVYFHLDKMCRVIY